jgi:hypothetical protein
VDIPLKTRLSSSCSWNSFELGGLNGRKPVKDLTLAEALSGTSLDPCVGRFLEFPVVRDPARPDVSRVPDTLIPIRISHRFR